MNQNQAGGNAGLFFIATHTSGCSVVGQFDKLLDYFLSLYLKDDCW